ncbi:LAFA_0A01442g1_1 [Lachancea sp. 'fantastica']|nr:LAFA_0A01442g1_1 [Lachancea sp. 'fantastica']
MRLVCRPWLLYAMRRYIYNDSKAAKVANLGLMTEYLSSEAVPHLLQKPINAEKLDAEIVLRLFPTSYAYLPRIHGITRYKHSMSLLTMVARRLVLHEGSGLHVTGVETITGVSKGQQRYNTISGNDKIVVHWESCEGVAENEDQFESKFENPFSQANMVKFGPSTTGKTTHVTTHSPDQELLNCIVSPDQKSAREFSGYPLTLLGELKRQMDYPRIIHGLFIFELNKNNTKILVHTIDNVEFYGRRKKQEAGASLAC